MPENQAGLDRRRLLTDARTGCVTPGSPVRSTTPPSCSPTCWDDSRSRLPPLVDVVPADRAAA